MDSICIAHAHDRRIGYGRMGVDLGVALSELGLDVSDWTEGWERHIKPTDSIHSPGRAKTVVFASPGTHVKGWFEGQRAIAYTMWEATELPEANRQMLHEYDQIIVPSHENLKLYSRYHDNVAMVPLGVGPEWHWQPRRPLQYDPEMIDLPDLDGGRMQGLGIPMTAPEFVVLTAGTSPLRKGFDLTAKAFKLAFPDRMTMSPKPVLMVKSPYGAQVEGVDAYVDGYLSDEEELELYASVHVYISLARGEGFGLQPLQAIAQGIPTILVDAHGHESFAQLGYGVRASRVPAPEAMGFGEAGEWWEADVEEAAVKLRWVYDNYAQAANRAVQCSDFAHTHFSWENTARMLVGAIGQEHLTPFDSVPHWHQLEPMKFLIRVLAQYKGTVNGVAYIFEPGIDYYDVADVKRMIARSGYLDPSCIGADGIVKADPRLSGSHAYCPTCLQRLNTQPTKADDMLAAMEA